MGFVILCILSGLISFVFGLGQTDQTSAPVISPVSFLLIGIGTTVFSYLSFSLASSFIIGQILIAICLLGGALIVKLPRTENSFFSASLLWITAGTGVLIGFHYIGHAILIFFLVGCFLLIFHFFKHIGKPYIKQYFVIDIEIQKLHCLDQIEYLLQKFNLAVLKKSIVKGDTIHLELEYYAVPLSHKLFLRKMYQIKGIGEIIRISL